VDFGPRQRIKWPSARATPRPVAATLGPVRPSSRGVDTYVGIVEPRLRLAVIGTEERRRQDDLDRR
jgi:hypothetical protein